MGQSFKGEYTLPEIGTAVEKIYGITLREMRTKDEDVGSGREVVSLIAKDYVYEGQDIAGYLWRDPSQLRLLIFIDNLF
ncbi:MAG: hypothetical protein AB1502_04775 [Thermodesulfobacteriota bacterium]